MTAHPGWETINDVADGRLAAAEQAKVSAHLAACPACAAQLASLHAMLAAAKGTADLADPPAHAWAEIRRTIESGKTVSFPRGMHREHGYRISRSGLAAAALVLMAVSSAVTAVLVRGPRATAFSADSAVTGLAAVSMASDIVVMEREYLSTATALRETLDRERSTLSPATIATVERSLKVIDDAIAEARDALVQDPANGALRELFRKSHQQKIDFLRRTTTLLQKA